MRADAVAGSDDGIGYVRPASQAHVIHEHTVLYFHRGINGSIVTYCCGRQYHYVRSYIAVLPYDRWTNDVASSTDDAVLPYHDLSFDCSALFYPSFNIFFAPFEHDRICLQQVPGMYRIHPHGS